MNAAAVFSEDEEDVDYMIKGDNAEKRIHNTSHENVCDKSSIFLGFDIHNFDMKDFFTNRLAVF